MEVRTVQEIFLNLGTVTLVLVLSMESGQPGHNGVTVARHVQMGQELATELAAIPFHSLGAEIVQEK